MEPSFGGRISRRMFCGDSILNLGSLAFLTLLGGRNAAASSPSSAPQFLAPRPSHFPGKAKNVIFLFMGGGPSQLDLFDHKPELVKQDGQSLPPSVMEGKQFPNTSTDAKLLQPQWAFRRHGASGTELSELLPELAQVADDLTIVKSMMTDNLNHAPAASLLATGSLLPNRPSIGSWVTYGLGSDSQDLPAFVVLLSSPSGPVNGSALWSSGFLPSHFSGVPLRSAGAPIMYLDNPAGVSAQQQEKVVKTINQLNTQHKKITGDPEIDSRIHSYEMTCRLQVSAPELTNLGEEAPETLARYGADLDRPSFGKNCLLARRLVERGVRFVQLVHWGWDQHFNLQTSLPLRCQETDRGAAALIQDLKQRGLLEETLVVWGGEFGRTPMRETRSDVNPGRDHQKDAFTVWLAGGGTRPGLTLGATDDFGCNVIEDPVHVHDLQATILHLLGLDHEQLTYRYQGRDFRLTDVHGSVVAKLLA